MAGGAAHPSSPAQLGKATVTGLLMEVLMMAMKGAKENLYVAAITVRSLDFIFTRKTTVATWLPQLLLKDHRRSLCWEYLWNHPKVCILANEFT